MTILSATFEVSFSYLHGVEPPVWGGRFAAARGGPSNALLSWGIGSGVGYYLWLWALSHIPSAQVTVLVFLSPIAAALLGAVFLAEPMSIWMILGLALTVLCLWTDST